MLTPEPCLLNPPPPPLNPPPQSPTPGKLAPDAGAREQGETAVIGYFEQHPPPVDPDLKLIDYVSAWKGGKGGAAG